MAPSALDRAGADPVGGEANLDFHDTILQGDGEPKLSRFVEILTAARRDAHWHERPDPRVPEGRAKSVFHFDVQGQVAKSTHAGLPWLRFLRNQLGPDVHFWPFDGWEIPAGRSATVEVYPRLWSGLYDQDDLTADQHDAYSVAAWLRTANENGLLHQALCPQLTSEDRHIAQIEGWILGSPM